LGELTKVSIIHALAKACSYTRYLEICTPTTGNYFEAIDHEAFELAHRMMYRWHAGFDGGHPSEYCTDASASGVLVQEVRRRGLAYDVILVDGWHEYDNAFNDLTSALSLLRPGGTVVVHDCMPPDAEHATPEHHDGAWCGVSYEAFLDVVLATNRLSYLTVDADYGCGIIQKADPYACLPAQDPSRDRAIAGWRSRERASATSFEYFQTHRNDLLNTIEAGDFDASRLPLSVAPQNETEIQLSDKEKLTDDFETEMLRARLALATAIGNWADRVGPGQVAGLAYALACLAGARRGVLPGAPPQPPQPPPPPPPNKS
jgi:hypothetical protein